MTLHLVIEVEKYGELRTRSLCGRSRADVVNVSKLDSGQNITRNINDVTCKYCLRIISSHPAKYPLGR